MDILVILLLLVIIVISLSVYVLKIPAEKNQTINKNTLRRSE
jgi:hypothetical protein